MDRHPDRDLLDGPFRAREGADGTGMALEQSGVSVLGAAVGCERLDLLLNTRALRLQAGDPDRVEDSGRAPFGVKLGVWWKCSKDGICLLEGVDCCLPVLVSARLSAQVPPDLPRLGAEPSPIDVSGGMNRQFAIDKPCRFLPCAEGVREPPCDGKRLPGEGIVALRRSGEQIDPAFGALPAETGSTGLLCGLQIGGYDSCGRCYVISNRTAP